MRTLKDLDKQLQRLEVQAEKNNLFMTLEDGRNIKIRSGSPDGIINLMRNLVQDANHPYRELFKQAIKGYRDQGQIVLICKALIESSERVELEKRTV